MQFIQSLRYDKTVKKFIFNSFKVLFFLIFFSFVFVPKSKAATCNITYAPSPVTIKDKSIEVKVTSSDFAPNYTYKIQLSGGNACYYEYGMGQGYCPSKDTQLNNGALSGKLDFLHTLPNGKYTIGVIDTKTSKPICGISFQVGSDNVAGGDSCNLVTVKPKPFNPKPSDYIAFKITGNLASIDNNDQLHTYIKIGNNDGATVWNGCIKRNDLKDSGGFGFGYLTSGNYYLEVKNSCTPGGLFELTGCYATFNVNPAGGGLGGAGNKEDPIPPGPCAAGANIKGTCAKVDTGLGPIGTDPQSLIKSVFGLILSISGGIALILIIISGYKILASQGNPETLKGAREQLTAAIVGLLFIIFALVILQIIGYDILRIPGFGSGPAQSTNTRIGGP